MKNNLRVSTIMRYAACILTALMVPSLAHAHVGIGQTSGIFYGLAHPTSGVDHFVAMVAVGLWAAQRGGRAVWAVPLSFVSVMAAGCLFSKAGVSLPFIEQGIIVSVLVLGMLIVAAIRLPVVASSFLVALFAIFHGHAHGAEMPDTVSGLAYGIGFMIATGLLHTLGIGIGVLAQRLICQRATQYAGGAITAIGIYLCFS
jgi:urease accessory protein